MTPPTTLGSEALSTSPAAPLERHGAETSRVEIEAKPRTTPWLTPRRSARRRYRVAAVVPCYNRATDVEKLLKDLSRLDTRGIDLWVVVVDNASSVPLSTISSPPNLQIEHVRLETNTGGAGGFNAGMSKVLQGSGLSGRFDAPDFVWLLDSDVRVSRRSLRELVKALKADEGLAAVGSALVDPLTRVCYELGGKLNRKNGYFVPAAKGDVDRRLPVHCEYLAACSALVRRDAIEKTGLMPEIFIHGDDVEWFLRITRATGKRLAAIPSSRAYHPLWSRRFQTWVRYYTTRNAYAPIDVCGLGARTRLWRSTVDVLRATAQAMMGMPELADLHLQGLADAAAGRTKGHGPRGGIAPIAAATKTRPFSELWQAVRTELASRGADSRLFFHPILFVRAIDFDGLRDQIDLLGVKVPDDLAEHWRHRGLDTNRIADTLGAMWRWLMVGLRGWSADVAIVPTGWPTGWFRGRVLIQVTSDGFLLRRIRRGKAFRDALSCVWRGMGLIARLTVRKRQFNELPKAPMRSAAPGSVVTDAVA